MDGTLDATFDGETGVNGNGFIRTDFGNASGHDQALGVAIQSDGKIVAVGYAFNGTNNDLAITRYNSNGSLDTTFSVDGKATYNFGFSGTEIAAAVAIDSQGRILVGGEGSPGVRVVTSWSREFSLMGRWIRRSVPRTVRQR